MKDAYEQAGAIAGELAEAGVPVNWNHDVNKVLPVLETVADPTAVYGHSCRWDGVTFQFSFSSAYRFQTVLNALPRSFDVVRLSEWSDGRAGCHVIWLRRALVEVDNRLIEADSYGLAIALLDAWRDEAPGREYEISPPYRGNRRVVKYERRRA